QAFRDYRAALWRDFPGLPENGDDTVGGALLRQGRVREAVPVLIREAAALSEPAERLLERLWAEGVDGLLPAHDARILGYFDRAGAAAIGVDVPLGPPSAPGRGGASSDALLSQATVLAGNVVYPITLDLHPLKTDLVLALPPSEAHPSWPPLSRVPQALRQAEA